MKTTQQGINDISGGSETYKLSAGGTYSGDKLIIGFYHTSAPATYSNLTDSNGDAVTIGDSLVFDGVVPLVKPSVPLKTLTCDVECQLLLG